MLGEADVLPLNINAFPRTSPDTSNFLVGLFTPNPTLPLEFMRILSFEFVPNVNVFDAGVNIEEPVPTPKVNPELSTNVVIPENIGPESVKVTVLKPARLVIVFVRISDVIYIFSYLCCCSVTHVKLNIRSIIIM
jgi:hypothetical protein